MVDEKRARPDYEEPILNILFIRQDVVTLSGGDFGDGNLGSDLGSGQIGDADIFG